ncbi:hypothetical protein FOA43_003024 [Brettanomyces nanus]|uniref:Uncharacterized protein n=1 Tax=Eeniella nana TaxID=13502 RepID=A0A875S2U6_EENNA|nr:uncharacterized protein FOA43_003024 [Brettanomyces nanus]QPG75666.1 hypothetical protein FOA43_003024 [Brettanomyces nanus]
MQQVLDLDLNNYLKVKGKLIDLISMARTNELDSISEPELEGIQKELNFISFRSKLNAKMDALMCVRLVQEYEQFDEVTSTKFMKQIDEQVILGKEIGKNVQRAEELLLRRRELSDIVADYMKKSGVIRLKKKEIEELFGDEVDSNSVIKGGRLLSKKSDEYEFQIEKRASFKQSCKELQESIDEKINRCEMMKNDIEQVKDSWKTLGEKLLRVVEILKN